MELFWWWWIAAIVVIAIELTTGTVYLLMVASGLAAGGVAAWLGQGFAVQLLVAALLAASGCWLVKRQRAHAPPEPESQRNEAVHIDLGNTVQVLQWSADRTSSVQYRGAAWSAKLELKQVAAIGAHTIVAIEGNTLVLKPIVA